MGENVLIIGLGQVGKSLLELLQENTEFAVYGYDIDEKKMREIGTAEIPKKIDVVHICYPCVNMEKFVKVSVGYMKRFKPKLTIIESTVPPGTTWKIYESTKSLLTHSPVRGVHTNIEDMKQELRTWTKYAGGVNQESAEYARKHFEKLGLKVKVLNSPFETEIAKLLETTYRALMIAWFQEMHRISRAFKADFDQVVDFLEDTHRVRLDRPILFPSVISGHCLIENSQLLLESYDSKFVKLILESNEKRKKEIGDTDILAEVEKVKRRVEKLNRDLEIKKAPFNPTI